MTPVPRTIPERRRSLALAAGAFLAPMAWALQLQINYSLTQTVCENGQEWMLHLVSLAALFLAAAGAAIAWWTWSRLTSGSTLEGEDPRRAGRRFVALGGLGLSLFFLLVIVAMDLPNWWLSACHR